jgi:hypothetical protein
LTASEICVVILGQEIAAPSVQRQQMAELEKSNEAQGQVTAVQTQTTNVHGDTIQTVTTTNYEQQVFSSKSDWRVRAISATHLPLRLQHIYLSFAVILDTPLLFWAEDHRPAAFLTFANLEQGDDSADVENVSFDL